MINVILITLESVVPNIYIICRDGFVIILLLALIGWGTRLARILLTLSLQLVYFAYPKEGSVIPMLPKHHNWWVRMADIVGKPSMQRWYPRTKTGEEARDG